MYKATPFTNEFTKQIHYLIERWYPGWFRGRWLEVGRVDSLEEVKHLIAKEILPPTVYFDDDGNQTHARGLM